MTGYHHSPSALQGRLTDAQAVDLGLLFTVLLITKPFLKTDVFVLSREIIFTFPSHSKTNLQVTFRVCVIVIVITSIRLLKLQ